LVVGLSDFSEMIEEYERLVKVKADPATKKAAELPRAPRRMLERLV